MELTWVSNSTVVEIQLYYSSESNSAVIILIQAMTTTLMLKTKYQNPKNAVNQAKVFIPNKEFR